jgi:hypothetical protein
MTTSTKTTAALILLTTGAILSSPVRSQAQEAVEPDVPGVASSSDMVFTPVTPCRLLDTRLAGGAIAANSQRNFLVAAANLSGQGGSATGCGVPTDATAAVVNFTVVSPTGPGNLRAYATANPQPAAPLAATMTFGAVAGLDALSNGTVVPLCDRATTTCPGTGDMRIQLSGSSAHVVADVLGYFHPGSGRAYATVNPTTPSLDLARTKNIVAVRRPSTGVYCLQAAAGLNPATSAAIVSVESGLTTFPDSLAQAVAQNTPTCNANEFLVRTYRFGLSPVSPTLSSQVAFYVYVP